MRISELSWSVVLVEQFVGQENPKEGDHKRASMAHVNSGLSRACEKSEYWEERHTRITRNQCSGSTS